MKGGREGPVPVPVIVKKKLWKLEERAKALKAPKGAEEDRKELIRAIREAKTFVLKS